jgi:hypothetical protein
MTARAGVGGSGPVGRETKRLPPAAPPARMPIPPEWLELLARIDRLERRR